MDISRFFQDTTFREVPERSVGKPILVFVVYSIWSLGECSLFWSSKQVLAHLSVALSCHAHKFNFPDLLQQRHIDVSLGER